MAVHQVTEDPRTLAVDTLARLLEGARHGVGAGVDVERFVDLIIAAVSAQVAEAIRAGVAEIAKAEAEILEAVRASAAAQGIGVDE